MKQRWSAARAAGSGVPNNCTQELYLQCSMETVSRPVTPVRFCRQFLVVRLRGQPTGKTENYLLLLNNELLPGQILGYTAKLAPTKITPLNNQALSCWPGLLCSALLAAVTAGKYSVFPSQPSAAAACLYDSRTIEPNQRPPLQINPEQQIWFKYRSCLVGAHSAQT